MSSKALRQTIPLLFAVMLLLAFLHIPKHASAETTQPAGHTNGFYLKSEGEGGMRLRLGGTLHADYRHYAEEARADNRFDIRRARLALDGQLTPWFYFALEYEFQGSETSNLTWLTLMLKRA